jgi:hypothetical protein
MCNFLHALTKVSLTEKIQSIGFPTNFRFFVLNQGIVAATY